MSLPRTPLLVSATLLAIAHAQGTDIAVHTWTPDPSPVATPSAGRLGAGRSVLLVPAGGGTVSAYVTSATPGADPVLSGTFFLEPAFHDPMVNEYPLDVRIQVIGDVNGDGADDYAVIDHWQYNDGYMTNVEFTRPYIYLADPATGLIQDADTGTAGIQPLAVLDAASIAYLGTGQQVLSADLDGTNGPDLVVWSSSELTIYLADPGASFPGPLQQFTPNYAFKTVAPHPSPRSENDVVLFVGDGNGVCTVSGTNPEGWWFDYNYLSPIDTGTGNVIRLTAGDVDGDGSADVAVVREYAAGDTIRWYRLIYNALTSPSSFTYGDELYASEMGYSLGDLRIVPDLDQDGCDDLVELRQESSYQADGTPFIARVVSGLSYYPYDIGTLLSNGSVSANLVFDADNITAQVNGWGSTPLAPQFIDGSGELGLLFSSGASQYWFPGPFLVAPLPPVINGGAASVAATCTEDLGSSFRLSATITATDADGDASLISWSYYSAPAAARPAGPQGARAQGDPTTAGGQVWISGTGVSPTIDYEPPANFSGSDSFSVRATDAGGQTATIEVTVAVAAVNDPPVVSSSPTTTGSAVGGRTLSAVAGTWSDAEDGSVTNLSYKWQRANDSAGSGAADIATGASLVLGPSEVGKWVQVVETATDSASASSATGSGWVSVAAAPYAVSVRGATIANPYTAKVGETFELKVVGGHPPYSASNSLAIASLGKVMVGLDLDGDTVGDLGSIGLFTPNAEGAGSVVVSDQDGNSATITFNATALPSVSVTAPTVAASTGSSTVYGVICPGTWQGVASLKAALAGKSRSEARAFAWDAAVQGYVELPTEPVGGLLPTHAVFLASRLSLPYDFNGWPAPIPFSIVLQPGWNFIGLPPLDDAGTGRRRHDFNADFLLKDEFGNTISGVSRTNLIGSSAKFWDGAAYQSVAVLDTGVGYWIQNASSPERPLVLVRQAGGMAAPPAAATSRTYGYRSIGSPPSPPSGGGAPAAESSGGGGGCGGGLAALVMLGGLAFISRRLRGGHR